jgi:hypothetical protein
MSPWNALALAAHRPGRRSGKLPASQSGELSWCPLAPTLPFRPTDGGAKMASHGTKDRVSSHPKSRPRSKSGSFGKCNASKKLFLTESDNGAVCHNVPPVFPFGSIMISAKRSAPA